MLNTIGFFIGFFMVLAGVGTAENELMIGLSIAFVGLILIFANINGINELDYQEPEENA